MTVVNYFKKNGCERNDEIKVCSVQRSLRETKSIKKAT